MLEDTPSDAKLVLHALVRDGMNFAHQLVDEREEFIQAMETFKPDIVLSDHQLASFTSSEALEIVRKNFSDIPFILVTGTVSEEFAVSIIKRGADDYILKGNLSRLSVSIHSAIAQREADRKFRRSEEKFQHTIDGMIDGVQIIDNNWRFQYVNYAAIKYSRYTKEEILGYTVMEKFPEIIGKEIFKVLEKSMYDRETTEMEYETLFHKEDPVCLSLRIQPSPSGILVVSTDITEKKKSYEQLRLRNQRIQEINTDLDRFLYSVSHELRTPICNGLGLVGMLRTTESREESEQILNILESSIKEHDALLQKIGLYTQLVRQDLVFETIDFQKLVAESFSYLNNMEGFSDVEFSVDIRADIPARSDKKRLLILITSLLSNGIKFRKEQLAEVNISIRSSADHFEVEVIDNGVGIPKEYLNDIFRVFYRANSVQEGNGLGLYFVNKIVELFGGKIGLSSEEGRGTHVKITLPNGGGRV